MCREARRQHFCFRQIPSAFGQKRISEPKKSLLPPDFLKRNTEKQQVALPPEVLFLHCSSGQSPTGSRGARQDGSPRSPGGISPGKRLQQKLISPGCDAGCVSRKKCVRQQQPRWGDTAVVCFYGGHQRELLRFVSASNPTRYLFTLFIVRDRRRPVINPTDLHFKSQ